MKLIPLVILFALSALSAFAQSPQEITEVDLAKLKQEIKNEALQLRQQLLKEDYMSDFEKQISIDFQTDTFQIEKLLARRTDIDYSTYGMLEAAYNAEAEYDKLLNKYYQLLLRKLNTTDKDLLKQSQRNWIQYRDSERKLNIALAKEEYSGGGTIQNIIIAGEYTEITKKRVLEIFHYLTRFYE